MTDHVAPAPVMHNGQRAYMYRGFLFLEDGEIIRWNGKPCDEKQAAQAQLLLGELRQHLMADHMQQQVEQAAREMVAQQERHWFDRPPTEEESREALDYFRSQGAITEDEDETILRDSRICRDVLRLCMELDENPSAAHEAQAITRQLKGIIRRHMLNPHPIIDRLIEGEYGEQPTE